MQADRFAEAEQVYRDDLARLPENGWALFGLAQSLRMQGKNEKEAAEAEARFKKVWAKADLQITSSMSLPAGQVMKWPADRCSPPNCAFVRFPRSRRIR